MASLPGKIADTFFKSGPNESLVATDVYAALPDTKALTSIPSIANNLLGEVAKAGLWLGSEQGVLSIVKSLKINSKGKVAIDADALKSRLIEASGGIASPFNDLIGKTQQAVLGTLSQTVGNVVANVKASFPEAFVVLDGVKTIVEGSKCSAEAPDTVKIINSALPDYAKFVDAPAEFAIYKQALDEASCLNLVNAAEQILDKFPGTEGIKLALSSAKSAIGSGNLDILNTFMDVAGVDALKARYPTMVGDLLKNFKITTDRSPVELGNQRTALESTLNRVSPTWDKTTKNGTPVTDLGVYSQLSPDANRVFSLDAETTALATIAGSYDTRNVDDLMALQYPAVSFA